MKLMIWVGTGEDMIAVFTNVRSHDGGMARINIERILPPRRSTTAICAPHYLILL